MFAKDESVRHSPEIKFSSRRENCHFLDRETPYLNRFIILSDVQLSPQHLFCLYPYDWRNGSPNQVDFLSRASNLCCPGSRKHSFEVAQVPVQVSYTSSAVLQIVDAECTIHCTVFCFDLRNIFFRKSLNDHWKGFPGGKPHNKLFVFIHYL